MSGNRVKTDWAIESIGLERAVLPDRYSPDGGMPDPHFVVGRNSLAEPVSYYKDNSWDWSCYTPRRTKCIIEFQALRGTRVGVDYDKIIDEAKLIIFTITWLSIGSRMSPKTILLYLKLLVVYSKYDTSNAGLIRSLSDESLIKKFIKGSSPHYVTYLVSLYSKLQNVVVPIVNVIQPSNRMLNKLKKVSKDYYTGHKQHLPLPSRIYLHLLSQLQIHIDEFYDVKEHLAAMINDFIDDPLLGHAKSRQNQFLRDKGVPFKERHYSSSMSEYISKQPPQFISVLNKYHVVTRKEFYALIREVLNVVKLSFLAYTGARKVEIANLKEQCLTIKYIRGKKVFLVSGVSSKLNKGMPKRAIWASSSEVQKAYDLASVVSAALYRFSGENGENRKLLPFGLARFALAKKGKLRGDVEEDGTTSLFTFSSKFIEIFNLMLVTESDIQELKVIDPFRDWVTEQKIIVGKPWPLTAHQLRRSLALYASNSGLVTLPALKRQLQHITDTMTAYYSNGNQSAISILGGENDFIDDYNEDQLISEFSSYVINVLMDNESAFGTHGSWLNKSNGLHKQVLLGNRRELMEEFRIGDKRYSETLLGGCTSTQPCRDKAMRNLVACLDCTGAVIQSKRLENVIVSQKNLIEKLNPESVEYRTEELDLKIMIQFHERITQKKAKD